MVVYADDLRCTGPARDILLIPRSRGILLAVPSQAPAVFVSFIILPGANEARELKLLGGRPASVLRLSMSQLQLQRGFFDKQSLSRAPRILSIFNYYYHFFVPGSTNKASFSPAVLSPTEFWRVPRGHALNFGGFSSTISCDRALENISTRYFTPLEQQ